MVYSNICCCLQQTCFAGNTTPTSQRFQNHRRYHTRLSNTVYWFPTRTTPPIFKHEIPGNIQFLGNACCERPVQLQATEHTHYLHCCPARVPPAEFVSSNFTTRREIQGHTTCPNLTACKNIPHTSEQFINTPAQHIGARQIDVHQVKYHDKRRELLAQVSPPVRALVNPNQFSTEAYSSRVTHYPGPATAHSSLSIPFCLYVPLPNHST